MNSIFNRIVSALSDAGIASPRMEARMICAFVCGNSCSVCPDDGEISQAQEEQIVALTERRRAHEPLDKILGSREFYKFRFAVNQNVLSPRPDSEILVEQALLLAQKYGLRHLFEFGVGSGCLLLSVLADLPTAEGVGIDKSAKALEIAERNRECLGLGERARLCLSDYMQQDISGSYDLILANPPYIPSAEIATLDTEVRNYDPLMALDGGADGLDHYRRLAELVPHMLQSGGFVLLEAGQGQADDIADIFMAAGLVLVQKCLDLAGIERCVILKK